MMKEKNRDAHNNGGENWDFDLAKKSFSCQPKIKNN